jgi:hypothetical protein
METGRQRTEAEWQQYWKQYWEKAQEMAHGRWDSILGSLAPSLGPAIDANGKRHVPCPVHGGKDGFRFFKGFQENGRAICNTCGHFRDGFAVLSWINGWTLRQSADEVMRLLTGSSSPKMEVRRVHVEPSSKIVRDEDAIRKSLNKVWESSVPISAREAEPARLYLAKRGISMRPPPALRFHPSLAYHDGEKITGYHPAIVSVVQSADGSPGSIHRIYLDQNGLKAKVDSPKKLMAYPESVKLIGGAIRLASPGYILGVAEGVETALAAMEGTAVPVWATVNAMMLERFEPPEGVGWIIVFSDKDRPTKQHPKGHGQESAKKLVARMWERGIKAAAITPAGEIPAGEKSIDWLDVLKAEGSKGFPALTSVRQAMLKAA